MPFFSFALSSTCQHFRFLSARSSRDHVLCIVSFVARSSFCKICRYKAIAHLVLSNHRRRRLSTRTQESVYNQVPKLGRQNQTDTFTFQKMKDHQTAGLACHSPRRRTSCLRTSLDSNCYSKLNFESSSERSCDLVQRRRLRVVRNACRFYHRS